MKDLEPLINKLQESINEAVNLQLDIIRRRALYPTLDSMDVRTNEIKTRTAAIPLDKVNRDVDHLLHHIDELKAELRKNVKT